MAKRFGKRALTFERMEERAMFAVSPIHNEAFPQDVNADSELTSIDALIVINTIHRTFNSPSLPAEGELSPTGAYTDVNGDGSVTAVDALLVVNQLYRLSGALENYSVDPIAAKIEYPQDKLLDSTDDDSQVMTAAEARTILTRASNVTASNDAIIAVVDRAGQILGVLVEDGLKAKLTGDKLIFAIDGAVAKARTAAFFSNSMAPLTSRTVRFISQSTITEREVESNPNVTDPESPLRGPGFVAPIGLGGHFPPEVRFTPLVDLFAIEHQSRDSSIHPGIEGVKAAGDQMIPFRFNASASNIPDSVEDYMKLFPESYGFQSGINRYTQSRGIATLPGGIGLYKEGVLVGGVGVFFPGDDGYATYEQGFKNSAELGGLGPQSETSRLNAPKVLEAEFMALFAGGGATKGDPNFFISVAEFEGCAPPLPGYGGLAGRIDLVGITLEIYGPTPTRSNPLSGGQQLLQVGRALKNANVTSFDNTPEGEFQDVKPGGVQFLKGRSVPEGWLISPHGSSTDPITKEDVERIVNQGIAQANITRAAIRLDPSNFRPGARTRMVFAVADSSGEVLGLFRMPDATIFSIDVAVAKARNTSYYASSRLQDADKVDADNNGVPDVPGGTAFTNRTFRFLAAPRFPTGSIAGPGDFSMLVMPGIDPATGENLNNVALPASVYASSTASVLSFDSFNASRNFRDPQNLLNQNGVVFFPGSTPLYKSASVLVGGFGVSGDGVDQDDVVTASGQVGYAAPGERRADQYLVAGVRLPFQNFNRNPLA